MRRHSQFAFVEYQFLIIEKYNADVKRSKAPGLTPITKKTLERVLKQAVSPNRMEKKRDMSGEEE